MTRHIYSGYADGSACYICGYKRDAAIHRSPFSGQPPKPVKKEKNP